MKLTGIFLLFVLISGVMSFSSFDTSDSSIPLKNIAAFAQSGSSNDKDNERDDDKDNERDDDKDNERDDDSLNDSQKDARKSINDAQNEIRKASAKITEATNKEKSTDASKILLEEAKSKLEEAKHNFDLGNFELAEDLAEESKDLAAESRMKFLGKTSDELNDDRQKDIQKQEEKKNKLLEKQIRLEAKFAEKQLKLIQKEKLTEERAAKLIAEFEKKTQKVNERLEKLLQKLDEGKYYGPITDVDPTPTSYTISLQGVASQISDSSNIVSLDGTLFLENLSTKNKIKKFSVTGGELFVGDELIYDVIFGKARLSSSGTGGEKDSMIVIAQVTDGTDVRTLKMNLDLSDTFDSQTESLEIDVLHPRSKIASQWLLSAQGTISLTESAVEPVGETTEPVDETKPEIIDEQPEPKDIPHTTSLSVVSDVDLYALGDTVTISGSVFEIFEDTPIILQLISPVDLIEIAQIDVNSDGQYTYTVIAQGQQWGNDGTYTVKAFYGANNFAETTFEFVN